MNNYKMSLEEITNTVEEAYWELKHDSSMVKHNFGKFLRKKNPRYWDLVSLAMAMNNWNTRPEGIRASVYRILALRGHEQHLNHYVYLYGNDEPPTTPFKWTSWE